MKIKMLITDLDGTLLNGQDLISSCDRNALLRVQDAGVKVVMPPEGLLRRPSGALTKSMPIRISSA